MDNRPARAAWPPPRRWLQCLANTAGQTARAWIQILSWRCGGPFSTGGVQLGHLVKPVGQVLPPALPPSAPLGPVGPDGRGARPAARPPAAVQGSLGHGLAWRGL